MKKIVFFILILFLAVPCFSQDDGFMEEIIDLDFMQQPQMQEKSEEINETDEQEQDKIKEFNSFKKQNEKEIVALKRKINSEEDGIVRLELENQIKAKKIEYQAKQYILDWADGISSLTIQDILKETSEIKKQTETLLNEYENLLETKNDFLVDKNKIAVSEEQDCLELEESIIINNKNKILISMINVLKPFMERLNKFQKDYFAGESGNRVRISSIYKSGTNFINLKIIYTSEQTVIYNLKYKISDYDKEEQALMGKSSKEFTIIPVFSVTQNNNGTIAKVLTGFNVKNSVTEDEQIITVSANMKEFYEIEKYKKMLKEYNE